MRAARGFTLIELMIVMVIIGLGIGLATVALGDSSRDRINEEADRLSALVTLAMDEAMLESQEMGLRVDAQSYQFFTLGADNQWNAVDSNDDVFRKRELPAGIELTLERDDKLDPEELDWEENEGPQIFIYTSGEMTPFTLRITNTKGDFKRTLIGYIQGTVEIEERKELNKAHDKKKQG
jgi:general secretion pathway protein H